MAQEFYLKAQALHEEFQKRELHYLNTEKKLNNSIMWKKDLNLPLQEYLQKINQREKETDETYRNILKQMEDLDRHTDVLSLKLEKLGILQTSVTNAVSSEWLRRLDPTIRFNDQTFGTGSLYTTQGVFPLSVKSVSTQTQSNLYCENCDSLIVMNNQSNHLLKHVLPTSNIHFGTNDRTETKQSSNPHSSSSCLLNETQNLVKTQYLESGHIEQKLIPVNHKQVFEENSKIEQVREKHAKQKQSFSMELDESENNPKGNKIQVNKGPVTENTQCDISKHTEKSSVSQSTVNAENYSKKTKDVESQKNAFMSKSDVDSINNEFDFLESDTANVPSNKTKEQQNAENIKSSVNHTNVSLDKVPNLVGKLSEGSKFNLESKEQEIKASPPNSKLNAVDDESETSGSLSGFHSPRMSIASDSDGVYENESVLTASAAYQALLGNTVLPRKTPKNVSGSESDEVENALASAVQRNHIKSKPSVKQKKDETSLQPTNAKPVDKAAKLSAVNKPQSKLSKNTRKVLGLDTSSGSEVEMAVRPQAKKIDEDSDEFGFYD